MTVKFHVALPDCEFAAGGDANLFEDQVDVGDHFGDRMLDLNARVHFDEVELAVLVQEFDGADAEIADIAHGFCDRLADHIARAGIERRRGAFLRNLLVATLQGTIAFTEMDGMTLAVAEHLDFDMARALEIFLDIDDIVAKCGLGLGARGR